MYLALVWYQFSTERTLQSDCVIKCWRGRLVKKATNDRCDFFPRLMDYIKLAFLLAAPPRSCAVWLPRRGGRRPDTCPLIKSQTKSLSVFLISGRISLCCRHHDHPHKNTPSGSCLPQVSRRADLHTIPTARFIPLTSRLINGPINSPTRNLSKSELSVIFNLFMDCQIKWNCFKVQRRWWRE